MRTLSKKHDLKSMHNNYFLQVQTIDNQKAIGAPTETEVKPDVKKREVSLQKTEKPLLEKICKNCNQQFFT